MGGGGYAGTVGTGSWLWWEGEAMQVLYGQGHGSGGRGRLCRYCRDRVMALVGGGGYAGTVGTGSLLWWEGEVMQVL